MDLWVGRMMVHIQGGKRAARRSSSVRQIHHLDNCMRLLMTPFSSEVCLASSSWLRPRCQTPSRQKGASFRGPLTPRGFRKVHDNQSTPGTRWRIFPPLLPISHISPGLSRLSLSLYLSCLLPSLDSDGKTSPTTLHRHPPPHSTPP